MGKFIRILLVTITLTLGLFVIPASAATPLTLNWKSISIGVSEKYTLEHNANSSKTVKWSSSDKAVATVNKNGRVKGIKTGKATITATIDGTKVKCKVTVKNAPNKISAKNVTVSLGDTAQIKATFPKNTVSKTITYKSSNTKIAKVNSEGEITGIKAGSCTITAKTYNKKSVTIKVFVTTNANKNKTLVVYFSMPETTNPNNMTQEEDNSVVVIDGKVLGNTQYIAYLIQENTGADIFRIEPKIPYPTDHSTLVDLASLEQSNNARPELASNITNIKQYDVIFLGYPNWWGDMPMILYSFLENVDLKGKTIIPFNTHGGSGFSDTIRTIAKLQPNATINKNGFTVSRNNAESAATDVIAWLRELGITK